MSEAVEKLVKRYEGQIEDLQEKVDNLERALEKAEGWANTRAWSRHRPHQRNDLTEGLPVPRLEISLKEESDWEWIWSYYLVYRHTTLEILDIPMGETVSRGGHRHDKFKDQESAQSSLPFRDGVHIRRDAAHLNFPAFVIAQGNAWPLEPLHD